MLASPQYALEEEAIVPFKQKPPAAIKPSSPRELYQILPKRPFPSLWGHQERILDHYARAVNESKKDVALELPTGSGKTLVGLLIGEYQRRLSNARVVYLCPTRQLVNQTQARAMEYGIPTVRFVGSKTDYADVDLARFQRGDVIAITNYASIFNIKPGLDDPQIIVCDDAHAGENYVADQWSLKISAKGPDEPVFKALLAFFGDLINAEIRSTAGNALVRDVDLVPLPAYAQRLSQLQELFDQHCYKSKTDIKWSWIALRGHLAACAVYVSSTAFLVRPLIPPTHIHAPFAEALHRVYMSATLGEDGDLERVFGVSKIHRVYADDLRDANTGRRFIVFPGMMKEGGKERTMARLLEPNSRVLLVVSGGHRAAQKLGEQLETGGFRVLRADDIESNLDAFSKAEGSVALVLTNRYDGIDLAGDACRRMGIVGVPGALNLQELFLRERLGAHAVLRNRVRVRLTQAMGRCTRSPSDYALVCCIGRDLLRWCSTVSNSEGLAPELQAELEFGLRQSEGLDAQNADEVLDHFFTQTPEWAEQDAAIRTDASSIKRKPSDSSGALADAVEHEIRYVQSMWQEDFVAAHEQASAVSNILSNKPGLKPYRAFWEYLAAGAADAAHRASSDEAFKQTFLKHIETAARLIAGVRWLAALRFVNPSIMPTDGSPVGVDVIEGLLEEWGIRGGRFEQHLSSARDDITSTEAKAFQRGLAALGRMLGFRSKQHSGVGAPDGLWWTEDAHFYHFEAKSDGKPDAPVSYGTVRQALLHPQWVGSNDKELPPPRLSTIVIVSPRTTVQDKAAQIAGDTRHLASAEAQKLFEEAATVLNEVRARAIGLDEETLREQIIDAYGRRGLTGEALRQRIACTLLRSMPQVVTP
jgi:hypothetical protein